MGSITDYVRQYGDRTFDELVFGEVDSLVLSQFSYLKFDRIMLREGECRKIRLCELAHDDSYEELYSDPRLEKENRSLLNAMMNSRRYSDIVLSDYVNVVDDKWEMQFSAITCTCGESSAYVAYRGTDETITGWKEDFNMAFMTPVPAQTSAARYLDDVASHIKGGITVGGHSKGGNLAVYAAMKCAPSVRGRIDCIYSHDGPGFAGTVLESEEFALIRDRIRKTVPGSSVVGMLLQTQENYDVVKCKSIGLLQHNPFNWIVDGESFEKESDIKKYVYLKDETVNNWIAGMSSEKRQEFVELLFEIIRGSGFDDLIDFYDEPVAAGKGIMSTLQNMDEQDRKILSGIVSDIKQSLKYTVKKYLSEKVDEETEKVLDLMLRR